MRWIGWNPGSKLEADDVVLQPAGGRELQDPPFMDRDRPAHPGVEICERGGDAKPLAKVAPINHRRIEHLGHSSTAAELGDAKDTALVPSSQFLDCVDTERFSDTHGEIHGNEPRTKAGAAPG